MSWHLRDLARWCEKNGHRELTREAAEGYVAHRLARTDPGQSTWVSYVRGLGRWMRANGHPDAHVLGPRWKGKSERRLPYLLMSSEVDAFFAEAARYAPRSPMRWQAKCLFGLMCSCGLRTCEARALRREDVDLGAGTLFIAKSKGHRSRTIAVTAEVTGMLAECDRLTTEAVGESREALFSTGGGRMLAPSDVTVAFRRIWEAAGLPAEGGGRRDKSSSAKLTLVSAGVVLSPPKNGISKSPMRERNTTAITTIARITIDKTISPGTKDILVRRLLACFFSSGTALPPLSFIS
jgi:integrase